MRLRWQWAFAALLTVACAEDGSVKEDESFHRELSGPLGWAPVIQVGDTHTGAITKNQIDLWAVELRTGDDLTISQVVRSGDLAPEFRLMSANQKISSASFNVDDDLLTKTYQMQESGRFFIAVRAYQGEGQGSYTIKVECNGGPCAGAPVEVPLLEPHVADKCIAKARACAFDDMETYNGAVGPTRARTLFTECLDKVEHDGMPCTSACEGDNATAVCQTNIEAIPFYADQSEQCIGELNRCVNACKEYADGNYWYEDGVGDGPDYICTFEGLHGSCDSYARDHEWCDGPHADGSQAQCLGFCWNGWTAWSDDDYGTCSEECL